MGLLSKLTSGATPQKKATDDALLLHAMFCMAGTDGTIGQDEMAQVEGYFMALPEFEGKNFNEVYEQAVKVLHKYPSIKDSIKSLAELSSPMLKQKCYLLCADIAMSSGDVDEAEDAMLEAIQRVCEVQDALAQKILEVLTLKYSK
jgi:hypothetical protein